MCVCVCVGMMLTTVNDDIHGDHILVSNGTPFTTATHNLLSDQLLENNGKTKDSYILILNIILILQLDILQQFSSYYTS